MRHYFALSVFALKQLLFRQPESEISETDYPFYPTDYRILMRLSFQNLCYRILGIVQGVVLSNRIFEWHYLSSGIFYNAIVLGEMVR